MPSGQEVLPTLDHSREWLISDGLGGSASGPVVGAATRPSQALLVAAGPHGRLHALLLRFEERVTIAGRTVDLARETPESFADRPGPAWRFRLDDDVVLERRVAGIRGHAGASVLWTLVSGPGVRLAVSPVVVARDPGALQPAAPELRGAAQGVPGRVQIETVPGRPALTLWHSGSFLPARLARRIEYAPGVEETALIPGHVEAALAPGASLAVAVSTEHDLFRALAAEERLGVPPPRSLAGCLAALEAGEREHQARWLAQSLAGADFTARQAAAAHGGDQAAAGRRREPLIGPQDPLASALLGQLRAGLVRRGGRLTLVDSLPLGAERGAAALRAVHALVTVRAFEAAREIIRGYLEYLDEGVAPEGFDPDDGRPLYGDPAPGLWLVSAVEFHVRRSGDTALLEAALGPLESILQAYRAGTRHGIRVDEDGLLAAGEGGAAVRAAGVNALWYHALIAAAQLARLAGRRESGAFYLAWARDHQMRFHELLWDEEQGAVLDRPAGTTPPRSGARPRVAPPEGLLAASLSPAVLPQERAERLLSRFERERLAPFGLREGAAARASTEWLGPFLMGWLRTHRRSGEARARVREWIAPIRAALERGAVGVPASVEACESCDAVPTPRRLGDPLSVLAAADLLRVWIEEMDPATSS